MNSIESAPAVTPQSAALSLIALYPLAAGNPDLRPLRSLVHLAGEQYNAIMRSRDEWRNAYGFPYNGHPRFSELERELATLRAPLAFFAARASVSTHFKMNKPERELDRESSSPVTCERVFSGLDYYSRFVPAHFDAAEAVKRAADVGAIDSGTFYARFKEWLDSRTGEEYEWTTDGKVCNQDERFYCNVSEQDFSNDCEQVSYYIRRGRGSVTNWPEEYGEQDAVKEACFYCEDSNAYFLSSAFTEIDCEGDTLCLEAVEDDVYYWESDGEYHRDYEPEESEEDEDSRGRASYHGSQRPSWWSNPAAKHGVSPDSFMVGMELECKCRDMEDFCNALSDTGLLTEEDGSLDSHSGVEVIGGPYTLAQYQEGKTAWHEDFFPRVSPDGITGHDAGTGYGIHLSVSRASFTSSLHLSKFVVFFNMAESLCCRVAQRANIYGGGYKIQKKVKASLSTNKYEPCKVDAKRAEVRIFRSNVRPERVLKNVEFVAAVYEFTKLASVADIQDEQAATSSFLAWLARVENLKGFPALASFLGERDNAGTSYAPFVSRHAQKIKGERFKAAPAPVAMDA